MKTTVSWRNAGTWGLLGLMFSASPWWSSPRPPWGEEQNHKESQWILSQMLGGLIRMRWRIGSLRSHRRTCTSETPTANFVTSPVRWPADSGRSAFRLGEVGSPALPVVGVAGRSDGHEVRGERHREPTT